MPVMKVLVVTARGLRADYLGCYGNPRVETPALDALAAGGVVFDRHFADAADPAGARRAWRYGRYLFPGHQPPPGTPDLIPLLNDRGVATHLIADASRPVPEPFTDGWQTAEGVEAGGGQTALEIAVNAARSALPRLRGSENWLLWVDLATPLPPWDVPDDFAEHYFRDEVVDDEAEEDEEGLAIELEPLTPLPAPPLGPVDAEDDTLYLRAQGSYSGAVTYFDAGLAELLRGIADDDVTVVVTSDVGFALGEHGFVGPGLAWPAESVTQLPLVVRLPGGTGAGRRVPALTQAVDLAPTLAALFGVAFPEVHGYDLAPLIRGKAESVRPYAVSWLAAGDKIGRALRSPEWSFVVPPGAAGEVVPHLYARPDDHWEVNDVRQHHLELTDAWEPVLREFENAAVRPGPLAVPALPDPEAARTTTG
jgi:arylsulfatase A-like enzyme